MKIGILGSGHVALSIAKCFLHTGHHIMLGSRLAKNGELLENIKSEKLSAITGTFKDATIFGEIIIIAVKGTAAEEAIHLAGEDNFSRKIVIDITNPLDFIPNKPPKLSTKHASNGELIQSLLPKAKVIKTLNIVGDKMFWQPTFEDGEPDMFLCGDDEIAKKKVTILLKSFGWENITDIGDIGNSRYMEALALLWITQAIKHNNWHSAFKIKRK